MSLVYRLMYRVGFTPWDTGEIPLELETLLEDEDGPPVGRALDIGCGTGTQAVYLARRGWEVTGVDDLDRPLRRARDRARAAGVTVDLVRADATRLRDARLTPGFTLLFDRGCFHGLSDQGRMAYAQGVTELAAPGAALAMMAFARNRVPAGPPGVGEGEIETIFKGRWTLESASPDSGPAPNGPLANVARTWYRLRRSPAEPRPG